MSITTLKKKHSAMYNISGGTGFSLNNSRRVESHSGEQRTQTSMRGLGYRGHGRCDFSNVVPINSNYVNYDPFNQGAISVKNTRGMLATRFKWINGTYPAATVQSLDTPTYESYYATKVGNATKDDFFTTSADGLTCERNTTTHSGVCNNSTNFPSYLHRKSKTACYQISNFVKRPQPDYKNYYRSQFLNNNNLPTPPALQHYPPKFSTSKHCCSEIQKPPSYTNFLNRIKCT